MVPNKSDRIPRNSITASLLIIILWGIHVAGPFLIPICMAALLAFTMAPVVRLLRQARAPEWVAIVVSSLLLVLPFLCTFYYLAWQGHALIKDLPHITEKIDGMVTNFAQSDMGHRLQLSDDFDLNTILQKFVGSAGKSIQIAVTGLSALIDAGSQLALVLLFAILMIGSRNQLRKFGDRFLVQTLPIEDPKILDEVTKLIEQFLVARLLILVIVGGVDTLILTVFGIPYSLLLGAILGVMTLLPAVGFIIGLIPPVIVALATQHSGWNIAGMLSALFIVSIIEGNILTPKIAGKRLNINALATFIGLYAGGLLWGIWGMLLSVPILGIVRILFNAVPGLELWSEIMAEKPESINYSHKNEVPTPNDEETPA